MLEQEGDHSADVAATMEAKPLDLSGSLKGLSERLEHERARLEALELLTGLDLALVEAVFSAAEIRWIPAEPDAAG